MEKSNLIKKEHHGTKNLIDGSMRTKEELSVLCRKAGKASVVKRRKKKNLKEALSAVIDILTEDKLKEIDKNESDKKILELSLKNSKLNTQQKDIIKEKIKYMPILTRDKVVLESADVLVLELTKVAMSEELHEPTKLKAITECMDRIHGTKTQKIENTGNMNLNMQKLTPEELNAKIKKAKAKLKDSEAAIAKEPV